ncbi:C40 family peptidase [Deinococcus aquiradiocola]|uniref:Peptidase n=1 Tax=Deinococcus aquiradiocola TaxID=393059 RepID=A0A917UKV2_9DEIO|nr:NlpC/P60 family protein [Deinococcus aquiradiocola]GGJ64539.1 peptidase [Deinococcus aquiradiocola]
MTPDTRVQAVSVERGVVESALADRFPDLRVLEARAAWAAGTVSVRARPAFSAAQVTEALHGEALEVLEVLDGGWSWVRTVHDGYLGYVQPGAALTDRVPEQAVTVRVPRSHVYAGPSIRALTLERVAAGASLPALDAEPVLHGEYRWWRVEVRGQEAFLHEAATLPSSWEVSGDRLAAFREAYLNTPYVWGGRSAWGLDCSGLAQLWAGRDAPDAAGPPGRSVLPRDADLQRAATRPVTLPRPGDLAFFEGHVGIMLNDRQMLHANATHLRVTVETLGEGAYGRRLADGLLGFGRLPDRAGTP